MQKLEIRGGRKVSGTILISGSKRFNIALLSVGSFLLGPHVSFVFV